jgi:hypothetical protein
MIENRVDLHNVDRPDDPTIRQDLHQGVGFAVCQATRNRCADAVGFSRVETVHIEADMQPRAVSQSLQSLARDGGDAAFVDIAHGEYRRARVAKQCPLRHIEIADPDQNKILRRDLRSRAPQVDQLRDSQSTQRRQWHPVDIPGRRRLGCVEVTMRVDPDQPNGAIVGDPTHRADRDRVIAP